MKRYALVPVVMMIAVGFILSACDVLFGTEEEKPSHLVVSSLSVSKAPLAATVSWIDPADTNISRIKITIDPPITGVAQPLFVDKGIQRVDVSWPEWTGFTYTFTFTAVDSSGTEYSSITLPVTPGDPIQDSAPDYLSELVGYPIKPGDDIIPWGSGYDSMRGIPLDSNPFILDHDIQIIDALSAGDAEKTITLVESTAALESYMQESTDVSVGASGSYGPFSASVSVDVSNSRDTGWELDTSCLNLIIHQSVRGPVYTLDENLIFNPNALSKTPVQFFESYGDRFAYQVLCGYDVYIWLEIQTSSETETETLADSVGVSAEAGAYGITASASVGETSITNLSNTLTQDKITCRAKVFGWSGGSFPEEPELASVYSALTAFHAAYVAATASAASSSDVWNGGAVEVRYRNYYSQLSREHPTYPQIPLGSITTDFRQLVLDERDARRLLERFYTFCGTPATWSETWDSATVSALSTEHEKIIGEIDRLYASLAEIRGYTEAEYFDNWTRATPTFAYDDEAFPNLVAKPKGTPPDDDYVLYYPTFTVTETAGALEGDYVEDSYTLWLHNFTKGSAGYIQCELPTSSVSAFGTRTNRYYIFWDDYTRSPGVTTGSLIINGTSYSSASGSVEFGSPSSAIFTSEKLRLSGEFTGFGASSIYLEIYRKSTVSGGTIITPIF